MKHVLGKSIVFLTLFLIKTIVGAAPYSPYPNPYYYQQPPVYFQQPVKPVIIATVKKPVLPTLELEISDKHPYIQQNTVLEVKLHSKENLTDLNISIDVSDNSILRPIDSYTTNDKNQEITTIFRYILTPFKTGTVIIDQVQVKGIYTKDKKPFISQLKQALKLPVKPSPLNIKTWYPLYHLSFKSKIQNPNQLKTGEPLVYQTEIYAEGVTAKQLSPLLPYLKSNEYKIYLDSEILESGILGQKKRLWGRRSAVYTLVPKFGGKMIIPQIKLDWWDLSFDNLKQSILPTRQIIVGGALNPNKKLISDKDDFLLNHWIFWLPVFIAVILLVLYWAQAFNYTQSNLLKLVQTILKRLFGDAYFPLASLMRKLSPRRFRHKIRSYIGEVLPLEWKLWYCLQNVNKERDPETWGNALQMLAVKHLNARPNSSMRQLTDIISKKHPAANANQLGQLMIELNDSIYGQEEIPNFSFWKRQFKAEIKPHLFFLHREKKKNNALLPKLN